VLLFPLSLALLWRGDQLQWPERWRAWNPFAPLVIADAPNPLTPMKLARLSSDDALCRSVLAGSGFDYAPVANRATGEGCGFSNAVRIRALDGIELASPFVASCRVAVSLAMWERHSLQPAAREIFASPVARLDHFGSYACRNLYGRSEGRRSRHATADALDVAGFVLDDGRTIRVISDWSGAGDAARFLHTVHSGACSYFSTVLGPEYNRAHRDHLHLDRGLGGICR